MNHFRSFRFSAQFVGLVLLAALSLAGCSSSPQSGDSGSVGGSSKSDMLAFTGPWASELTSTYGRATTDFERKILADGKVTDSEFSEMESRFKNCLTGKGLGFTGFDVGGGYRFDLNGKPSEEANAIADECSVSAGVNTVGYMYFQMQRNPQHLDISLVTAACLVKKGVVPKGYTASDFNRDNPQMAFPFTDKAAGEKALDECARDPLGLLAQR